MIPDIITFKLFPDLIYFNYVLELEDHLCNKEPFIICNSYFITFLFDLFQDSFRRNSTE